MSFDFAIEEPLERQKILDWVCSSEIDYADQQRALKKRRQTRIGEWFLGGDKFQTWIHGDHTTLLCSGMPGVGKTMITSFVVSDVLERGEDDLTPDEVSVLLESILGLFEKSVLIIDALDELPVTTRDELLSQILTLQRSFNINIFATSRHVKMTQESLNGSWVEISIRHEDLKCSAAAILKKGLLLRERSDLQQRALSRTLHVADGILLLAVLYAQHMAGMKQMKQLFGTINGLKSVSDPFSRLYANAMQRLQQDNETGDTKLGLTTICWLLLAKRPLRLRELLHALAIDERISYLDDENVSLVSHIVDACAGLIVVDETNDTVGLFHKTFHEYLVKNQSVWFPQDNDTIGLMCVRYLSFDASASGPSKEPDRSSPHFRCQPPDRAYFAFQSRLIQYPLYDYASKHWHDHIRGSNLETADIVMEFLADTNKVSASCQRLESLTPQTTGTHLATELSLEKSLKHHLESCRPEPDVKDKFGRSPLTYAAEFNDSIAIDHLIEAGADPNLALSFAARNGHPLASKALLQKGADVNYCDKSGRSALSYAAERGSEAVTQLLLQSGAQIDPIDSERRTPLFDAAAADSIEVASLLLERGANVNQADLYNITPLLAAARAGSERMIALLIARGARANTESYENDTPHSRAVEFAHPLTRATKFGSKEIVRLLISVGFDVNKRDRAGLPPLAYAAKNGWADIVKILLEKGAQADNTKDGVQSILSYAVENGSKELVELLLTHGANINRLNGQTPFCEPLYWALGMISRYGGRRRPADEHMLHLLLTKGANPNAMMIWEPWRNPLDSPLLYALQNLPTDEPSTTRMIKLLLEHGAKTDQVTQKGVSVYACAERHSREVQELLHHYDAQ
ncbi:hypothetical protein KCU91_g11487, partial [Aureobasidium melanogenum]